MSGSARAPDRAAAVGWTRAEGRPPGRVRLLLALTGFGLLALTLVVPAAGAGPGWNLSSTPASIPLGSEKTVTVKLVVTGSSTTIGCVELDLSDHVRLRSASIAGSPDGTAWKLRMTTGRPGAVTVHGTTEADQLSKGKDQAELTLDVRVVGEVRGSSAWVAAGFADVACTDSAGLGTRRVNVNVAAPAVTPSPSPTPAPTARPTPRHTPAPTPRPTARPPQPGSPTATASPSAPGVQPVATQSPGQPGATPAAAVPAATGSSPAPPSSPGPGAADRFEVGRPPGSEEAVPVVFSGGALLGELEWLVPAAALANPGLVIIVAITAQLLLGIAWLRVARRAMRGGVEHEGPVG